MWLVVQLITLGTEKKNEKCWLFLCKQSKVK